MKIQKIEDCRKVYRDIVVGYTAVREPRCFIKHLREIDLGSLENRSDSILEQLKENNIPTEKEVLAALDKKEIWTKANEDEFAGLIQSIKDLELERRKIVSREQVEQLLKFIGEERKRLEEISRERDGHLKISAEHFLRKKAQEELIKISFYKDEKLTEPLLNNEEFDAIDYKGLGTYFELFNEMSETMSESNIKKVSVTPAFLNLFCLADNINNFYGKSIVDLTIYQCDLFHSGKINRQMIEQGSVPPTDYSDLDRVVLFFDAEYSIALGRAEEARKRERHNER